MQPPPRSRAGRHSRGLSARLRLSDSPFLAYNALRLKLPKRDTAMSSIETLPAPVLPSHSDENFRREQQAFRRLLPELLSTHRDRYVAIHEGQVVESGAGPDRGWERAYAQFGYIPILVTLVTDEPRAPGDPDSLAAPGWRWTWMTRYASCWVGMSSTNIGYYSTDRDCHSKSAKALADLGPHEGRRPNRRPEFWATRTSYR